MSVSSVSPHSNVLNDGADYASSPVRRPPLKISVHHHPSARRVRKSPLSNSPRHLQPSSPSCNASDSVSKALSEAARNPEFSPLRRRRALITSCLFQSCCCCFVENLASMSKDTRKRGVKAIICVKHIAGCLSGVVTLAKGVFSCGYYFYADCVDNKLSEEELKAQEQRQKDKMFSFPRKQRERLSQRQSPKSPVTRNKRQSSSRSVIKTTVTTSRSSFSSQPNRGSSKDHNSRSSAQLQPRIIEEDQNQAQLYLPNQVPPPEEQQMS